MKYRYRFLLIPALLFFAWAAEADAATVTQISDTFFIIEVPAGIPGWQSTGLTICADSQWSIQVQGLSSAGVTGGSPPDMALQWHGPGGQLSGLPFGTPPMFVSSAPPYSLVGDIGGTSFYVGEGGRLSGSIGTGLLSLAFNDNYYDDNGGLYVVYLNYISGSCPPVAVESRLPQAMFRLGPGSPNPTSSGTELVFDTPERASYTVAVLDVQGRQLRVLHGGVFEPGSHVIRWDATDAGGRPVSPGTYFCVVTGTAGQEIARKIVVVP